jgi:DeoR/GlpR family transcriptional regulator of sugar metabolism
MSDRARLRKPERHERIIAELRANPTVRIAKLAQAFEVSTETVRRDLDELSRSGKVNRTYGGAALPPMGFEPGVNERLNEFVEERRRIAERAADLVKTGEVVMIDGGSTTTHFARRIAAESRDLTVVTNSLGVATVAALNPSIRVIVCPGDYMAREGIVSGPETIAFLSRFHGDMAVIGAGGLTVEGPSEVHSGSAWVKRTMLARCPRGVLVVDRSKFDTPRHELVCALDELDDVVVDAAPDADLGDALEASGVTLHVAE